MVSQELQSELREQLLAERQRLEREIANIDSVGIRGDTFLTDETDTIDQHPADAGTELFEREKNLTVQHTLEQSLQDINDALERMKAGTYGICENCGEPIPEKRLRAMPEARYCIQCQTKADHGQLRPAARQR